MPRGRSPTSTVATTPFVARSTTETVLPSSLDTNRRAAAAGEANHTRPSAASSRVRPIVLLLTSASFRARSSRSEPAAALLRLPVEQRRIARDVVGDGVVDVGLPARRFARPGG